jgi:hypothetical protein
VVGHPLPRAGAQEEMKAVINKKTIKNGRIFFIKTNNKY